MGDRTSVCLTLAGHFETVEALEEVCNAIGSEGMAFDWDGHCPDADEIAKAIGEAVANGEKTLNFYEHEVNYGNLEYVEAACQEHGVAFSYSWDAGGSYGAGVKTFVPGRGIVGTSSDGDNATVALAELRKAIKAADPLAAIREVIATAEIAAGLHLAPLSISEAVKAHIAAAMEG